MLAQVLTVILAVVCLSLAVHGMVRQKERRIRREPEAQRPSNPPQHRDDLAEH